MVTTDPESAALPPELAAPHEVIGAFFATDITDPEAVEGLRLSCCRACRETVGRPEPSRLTRCEQERCALRHDAQFWLVARELRLSWHNIMESTDRGLQDAAINIMNQGIWKAAPLTLAIKRLPNGAYTLGTSGMGLRGALYLALLRLISQRGGDVIMNISDNKAKVSAKHLSIVHQTYQALQEREEAQRAAEAFARNSGNESKAAAELGIDRKKFRGLLRLAGVKPIPGNG